MTKMIERLPFADYITLPGLNISTLCYANETMLHLKAALDKKIEHDSPSLAMGRAVHARLLEPAVYRQQYVVSKPCSAVIKSGARAGRECGNAGKCWYGQRWYCGVHAPDGATTPEYVTEDEYERIEAMYRAVLEHDVVKLIRLDGGYETTLLRTIDGIDCKMRLDKLVLHDGYPAVIVDIKKVRRGHAGDAKFSRAVDDYHYDAKAAWYVDGVCDVCARSPKDVTFVWVVVEDNEPFSVRAIQADADTLAIGRLKYCDWLVRYKKALESGEWPGYSKHLELGGVSEWARKKWAHLLER